MSDYSLSLNLKEFWYIAAKASELKKKPVPRVLLNERIVLFRDSSGHPKALVDRCAHRNLALSLGQVSDGCLVCSYHGWKYNGEGVCKVIPSSCSSQQDTEKIFIKSYPAEEQDGYVWVYMGAQAPTDGPRRFPNLGNSGWTTFAMKTRFSGSTFSCLENFLDCPHTTHVHTGWFRSKKAKKVMTEVRRGNDWAEVEFFEERDAQSIVSRLLFPKGKTPTHTDKFLMPTTSRVDYKFSAHRHFIITSQCTPITENETEVYTIITYRFRGLGPLVRLFFEPLCRRIIKQDVDILIKQTANMEKFGGPRYRFVESDLIGPHILHLWKQHLRLSGEEGKNKNSEKIEVRRNVPVRF